MDTLTVAPDSSTTPFAIEEFLAVEQQKDLLRFSTAGSVDDGKSTLIGRLLYDSRNVYEDHLRAVTGRQPVAAGKAPVIDFAQLTDGLRAEREQGITIDVAYRYFSTTRRKFIIADTPGHEQYTRNMATGASTADVAIILIDARKGILTQSRRHAYIASLLGIRHLVAAVNKMDLVEFSEEVYARIAHEMAVLVGQFDTVSLVPISLVTIPVSALEGDNVVDRSTRTPWYAGPTLLEYLEQVDVAATPNSARAFRMPVQRVIRPDQHYRGFAGQIASGMVRPGDEIVALPSGRRSRVTAITTYDGDLDSAAAPQSIALTLADELDISRGDLLAIASDVPESASAIEATLVWFDADRLETERGYRFQHGTQTLNARITRVAHRTNIQTLETEAVPSLGMNEIGVAELVLTRPIFFDSYSADRAMGSFILIDPTTNRTVAAGMIRRGISADDSHPLHRAALVLADELPDGLNEFEASLIASGINVVRTRVASRSLWQSLLSIGLVVLLEGLDRSAAENIANGLEVEDGRTITPEALLSNPA